MFCPKCGVETSEGYKFCKSCGTNLQIVSDAIQGGEDTLGQLRLDLDGLKRAVSESGKAIAEEARKAVRSAKASGKYGRSRGRHGWSGDWGGNWKHTLHGWDYVPTNENGEPVTQDATRGATTDDLAALGPSGLPRGLPRPKEWLKYSKQRNIRDGLMSLMGGIGMGAVFYYVGKVIIDSGSIAGIAESSHVHDLDKLLYAIIPLWWLVAVIPVLKGLGQLIYGIFIAESMSKISGAFGTAIRQNQPVPQQIENQPQQAAPNWPKVKPEQDKASDYVTGAVPPPSVTENTTNILEKA